MPAEMHAKGFAREDPVILTVDVEAFCSWSAWRIRILSRASTITGGIYSRLGDTHYSEIWVEGVAKHHVEEVFCVGSALVRVDDG